MPASSLLLTQTDYPYVFTNNTTALSGKQLEALAVDPLKTLTKETK